MWVSLVQSVNDPNRTKRLNERELCLSDCWAGTSVFCSWTGIYIISSAESPACQLQFLGLLASLICEAIPYYKYYINILLVSFLWRALTNIPALLERFAASLLGFIAANICFWWKIILTVAKANMKIITWVRVKDKDSKFNLSLTSWVRL